MQSRAVMTLNYLWEILGAGISNQFRFIVA